MTLELNDDEKAALIELLRAEVERDGFRCPHVTRLRSILAKLSPSPTPATAYPPPKPPGEPSAMLAKKRRR